MRKLELNINNKNYTLMMNRESIKWLETNGFNAEEFNKKPITFYDLIWTSLCATVQVKYFNRWKSCPISFPNIGNESWSEAGNS